MRVLRIAVAGAGIMGKLHAKALADCDVTELAGIIDILADRGEELARSYGVPAYRGITEALENDDIDAYVVAVPDALHVDITLKILDAGRHVLLEKPMAHSLSAAMEIYRAARTGPGRLTVAHILRHDTRFAGARAAVEDGQIGEVVHVRGHRFVGSFVAEANNGRSPLWLYQGVHDVDLAQWITGHPISEVQALASRGHLEKMGVEGVDAAFVNYRLANGALGALHYSWVLPEGMPAGLYAAFEVTGARAPPASMFRIRVSRSCRRLVFDSPIQRIGRS